MSIQLFHQCGHHTVWNRESFENDGCGNGLILSPVHESRARVEALSSDIKHASFFDPQYYLPSSQKIKFKSYEFFPEVMMGGFATTDFYMIALDSARSCLNFQIEQEFRRVIVPARHHTEMVTNYTESQDAYSVHPFLQAIEEAGYAGEVFLTLPLTKAMVMDDGYRTHILNWATSYPRIDGVYLLVDDDRPTKQIHDAAFLQKYLQLVKELTDVGFVVVVGHANAEGLLFTLIEGCEITFGAYENTRIFSVDKFVVSDEERRGPTARLYVPGLFNWIRVSHAKEVQKELPEIWNNISVETGYSKRVLEAAAEPHFTAPDLYKHFFVEYQRQVNALADNAPKERYAFLREKLQEASGYYASISDCPIDLDRHGNGDHVQPWLDAINWFFRQYLR